MLVLDRKKNIDKQTVVSRNAAYGFTKVGLQEARAASVIHIKERERRGTGVN